MFCTEGVMYFWDSLYWEVENEVNRIVQPNLDYNNNPNILRQAKSTLKWQHGDFEFLISENDSTVKKEDSPKRSSEHEVCLVKSVVLDLTLEEQNFLQALNKSFVDTTNKFYYSIFSDHPSKMAS